MMQVEYMETNSWLNLPDFMVWYIDPWLPAARQWLVWEVSCSYSTCTLAFADVLPALVEKEKTTPPEEEKPEG